MLISTKRIIKTGWRSFCRNIGPNLGTIFIMIMVLTLATSLFFLKSISGILISDLQKKVDVSVYFKEEVLPDEIFEVKLEIAKITEVKEVEYISREQALEEFVERHKDDSVLMESIAEVGYNPFLASLNIKAHQASQYEQVANFLETGPFRSLIDKVDYYQRKDVIGKVFSLTSSLNRAGIILSFILGIIAVLIAFNTIRIAIYNSLKEISIMRLVGASNWFVRGPFLVQGVIVGIFSVGATLLITLILCWLLNSKIAVIVPNISLLSVFFSNFWSLLLIQLAAGVLLGVFSSFIAIRKYLKV